MNIIEGLIVAFLLYIFINTPGLVAPVTCTTPEPLTAFNIYPFIWALVMTATGLIIGVVVMFGKELLARRFNEA